MIPEQLSRARQVFTDTVGLPSDNNHDPSNIIYADGKYHLWVTQHFSDKPFVPYRDCKIILVTSVDGIHWDEPTDALLPSLDGWDNCGVLTANVTLCNGKYYMFYTGVDKEYGISHSNMHCGAAVSDKAEGPYVRYESNPIIGPSGSGWDEAQTDDLTVLEHEGKFRLYYKCGPPNCGSEDYKIGIAFGNSITGPFTRYESNPLIKGHAFAIWKFMDGFLLLTGLKDNDEGSMYGDNWDEVSGTQSLYWSKDGFRFTPCFPVENRAVGIFPGDGKDITTCWGVTVRSNDRHFKRYIQRFDFVLD